MVVWRFSDVYLHAWLCSKFSMIYVHACYNSLDNNFHHPFKFFNILWSCMIGFQNIGGDLHNFNLPCAFAIKSKFFICTSSGGVPLYHVTNAFAFCTYTSIIYSRWKLNWFVINYQKGGDCKCIKCPLSGFGVLTTNRLSD